MGTAWIVTFGIGTVLLGLVLFLAMQRNRKHETPARSPAPMPARATSTPKRMPRSTGSMTACSGRTFDTSSWQGRGPRPTSKTNPGPRPSPG